MTGVAIDRAVSAGGGSISPLRDTTRLDGDGPYYDAMSTATLTLGPNEGMNGATATAPDLPGAPQVTFTANAVGAIVQVIGFSESDAVPGGSAFIPGSVIVPVGGTVRWIWVGGDPAEPHNVTFEDQVGSSATQLSGSHGRTFDRSRHVPVSLHQPLPELHQRYGRRSRRAVGRLESGHR